MASQSNALSTQVCILWMCITFSRILYYVFPGVKLFSCGPSKNITGFYGMCVVLFLSQSLGVNMNRWHVRVLAKAFLQLQYRDGLPFPEPMVRSYTGEKGQVSAASGLVVQVNTVLGAIMWVSHGQDTWFFYMPYAACAYR